LHTYNTLQKLYILYLGFRKLHTKSSGI